MAYVVPNWTNDQSPALNASNMQDISDAIGAHDGDISTIETNVSTLQTDMTSIKSSVVTLTTQSTAMQSAIYSFLNVPVAVSAWVASEVSADYPFQASIACAGVTAQHTPIVSFDLVDAESGNYAPVAVSGAGLVTIYAKVKPTVQMTIPSILAFKRPEAGASNVLSAGTGVTNVDQQTLNQLLAVNRDYIDTKATEMLENARTYTDTKVGMLSPGGGSQARYALNVVDYGLIGDGVTDNSTALTTLLADHPNEELAWPSGTYCFSHPISVSKAKWRLLGATLKYTGGDADHFVRVVGGATQVYNDNIPWNDMYIVGNGFLDGGKHAGTILQIGAQHMMEIRGLRVHSFTHAGLEHCYDGWENGGGSNGSYELTVSDCEFYNDDILPDTYGVIASHDSVYTNLIVRNATTAMKVKGGGNCIFNLHAWCFDFTLQNKTRINGTTFVELWGTGNRFTSVYSDTYQYSFVAKKPYVHCIISDMCVFWNKSTLPDNFKAVLFVPYSDGSTVFFGTNIDAGGASLNAKYLFWEDASLGKNCRWATLAMDGGTNAPSTSSGGSSIDTSTFMQKVSNVFSAGNARITAVGTPVNDTDAVTKAYADAGLSTLEQTLKAYVDAAIEEVSAPDPSVVACEGITLSQTEWNASMDDDASLTLTATVSPLDCTQPVTWTSTNNAVATVDGGVVTVKGEGNCTITARCGRKSATCAVTVQASQYVYLAKNMDMAGSSWSQSFPEGFSFAQGDELQAKVDLSDCLDSDACELTVGMKPASWLGNNAIFYYTKSEGKMIIDVTRGDYGGTNKKFTLTGISGSGNVIRITKDGIYWNDELKAPASETAYTQWTGAIDGHLSEAKVSVGTEGVNGTRARYEYIRVKKA